MDRREEIEKKRLKLLELKKAREARTSTVAAPSPSLILGLEQNTSNAMPVELQLSQQLLQVVPEFATATKVEERAVCIDRSVECDFIEKIEQKALYEKGTQVSMALGIESCVQTENIDNPSRNHSRSSTVSPSKDIFPQITSPPTYDSELRSNEMDSVNIGEITIAQFLGPRSPIHSIDVSPQRPELFATAHSSGQVCLWNRYSKTNIPSMTFSSSPNNSNGNSNLGNPATHVIFNRYSPFEFFVGYQSGSICLFDSRSGLRPSQQIRASISAHTYPIISLNVVGGSGLPLVASLSSDGRLCSWSLDMFAKPVEILSLFNTLTNYSNDFALENGQNTANEIVTSAHWPRHENSLFYIGTQSGCLYRCQRIAHASHRAGIVDSFSSAHSALISSIDCMGNDSDKVVTTSFDWSARIFHFSSKMNGQISSPISKTIAGTDAVCSGKWINDASIVFSDIGGNVRVYDIGKNGSSNDNPSLIRSQKLDRPITKFALTREGSLLGCGLDGTISVINY